MKLLKFLVRNYPGAFALALAASVLAGAFNAGLLALLNAVLSGRGVASSAVLAAFAALCLLLPLSRFATECLLTRIAQEALYDLRLRLSRRILSTPLRRLEEFGVQRLMTSLTEDVPVVSGTLAVISNLCLNIAIVVGGLVYLGWLSPAVLLVTLGFLAVGVLLYQLPVIKATTFLRRARLEADRLFGHFRALTTGTKELKLHRRRREMFIARVMEPSAAALRRDNTVGSVIYTAAASWGQSMIYVIVGSVVFLLPALYDSDQRVLTGYTLTLLYLMTPLQVIMNTLPNLTRAGIALERVEKLGLRLAAGGTEEDAPRPPEVGPAVESVEMAGVTHSYRREGESSSFVLGPANMSLRPGELVFLVGGNGGGKTTLAKLLTGLYVPEGGEVRLNGRPVTDENREQYRELFSMVFSDFYLFESLIGLERPSLDEQARHYLVRLQLDHKVKVSEGTLSTTDLSQGQRKRLALLVAYLEDRPVYVFDEWAADQDPQFKEFFYLQLLPELRERGKAVLVISHDDRFYHVADRLLKLEDGRLEELSAAPQFAPQTVGGAKR